MDAIVWLVLLLLSAWLAYSVANSEGKARGWGGATSVGIYLAVFGAIAYGLITVWGALRPKLVDDFASENTLLFVGLVVAAALVVCILDLLGTVDVMSKVGQSTGRPSRPAGETSGDQL